MIHGAGRPGVCQLGCLEEGGSHCLRVSFVSVSLAQGCSSDAAARTLHKRGAQGVAREDAKNPKSKIGTCASENVGEQKKPALSAP